MMNKHLDTFLMCAPEYFEVSYIINPWMEGNVARGNRANAQDQWQALMHALQEVAQVECMPSAAGVPDMVFTANGGLVLGDNVILSNFRHVERKPEEAHFAAWFAAHGLSVLHMPHALPFEGAGDALLDRGSDLLWFGHGHRSDVACAPLISEMLNIEVQSLKLADPRFYHLDTCFCPLQGGYLLYYPDAFDAAAQAHIAARVPAQKRFAVSQADALNFGCNAVNSGQHVFLNQVSPALCMQLERWGFNVHQIALTEFMKAGGAAKCLTLKMNEPQRPKSKHAADGKLAESVPAM
ncbi:dimethylarginine dimethylaminohydrolase family protein [Herminiimonas sp. NPDC097707]|uniref:dimethylarginine dimethylaminohydrolase family protein n=1 Tax=Herminiimonas sp. NPDC097707 TaxID=3364007 RepID=UPI00383ABAC1